jgi:hypothetical protein
MCVAGNIRKLLRDDFWYWLKRGQNMHVTCSYCGRYIREIKPFDKKNITQDICLDCFVPTSIRNGHFSYDEYLERCDVPVLILDSQQKVLAANQICSEMLEKPIECLKGILPGEALECRNSKLPGGCSGTTDCQTCTIRNLILKTMTLGVSFHYECVSLETEKRKSNFLVSTIFYNDVIQIFFEDCSLNKVELS